MRPANNPASAPSVIAAFKALGTAFYNAKGSGRAEVVAGRAGSLCVLEKVDAKAVGNNLRQILMNIA